MLYRPGDKHGIYIHIPFCRRACHYCDFHFSTSLKYKDDLVDALKMETVLRKNYFASEAAVQTIYFGGGTPSLLSGTEIMDILDTIYRNFRIADNAEVTIEANPDDLTAEKVSELKKTPVNRLSIGVQSFHDRDLQWLNRIHSGRQAKEATERALHAGFSNINIDLIFGIPGLTDEKWLKNLEVFHSYKIPHLSAYGLTVEKETPLYHLVRRKKKKDIDDERQARQYGMAMDFMERNGYIHYEISNFAREGLFSLHNLNGWRGGKYLGLGPSAHSYNTIARQWNVAQNIRYIEALKTNRLPIEEEMLAPQQQYNEYVLIRLRTFDGCDIESLHREFGEQATRHFLTAAARFIKTGELAETSGCYRLTRQGKFFADRVIRELFMLT